MIESCLQVKKSLKLLSKKTWENLLLLWIISPLKLKKDSQYLLEEVSD